MKKSSSTISIAQLKKSPIWEKNKHLFEVKGKPAASKSVIGGKIVSKVYPQSSKEKMAIEFELFEFCQQGAIILYSEYRFTEERKWRLDYYFEHAGKKIGIEYEGIFSDQSRHTNVKGYSGDTDKYREAAKLGITILRYTAMNYQALVQDLHNLNL